jgi:membrane-bound lytic murein transglycosylase B
VALLLALPAAAPPAAPGASDAPSRAFSAAEQDTLRARLARAGLEESWLAELRLDTLKCYPGRLLLKLSYPAGRTSYAHYLQAQTVSELKDFLRREAPLLAAAEARHGVPAEVLGAILMVETRLGRQTGPFRAPDLFLTLLLHEEATSPAALDTAEAREARFAGLRSRRELEEIIRGRARERAAWALKEFRTLARLVPVEQWRTLPCSFAGAIGLPQFMPTSLGAYGDDGDGNGVVELGNLPDAVFSIGRFLKENGWRGRMSEARRQRAVRRYNHSEAYARTVLKLARAAGMP